MLINIEGIPVEIERKRIKTLRLTVRPDGVAHVSTPWLTPRAVVVSFVLSRLDWVKAQRALAAARSREPATGDTLWYFGRALTLRFERASGRDSVRLAGDTLTVTCKDDSTAESREKKISDWYRAQLKERIAEALPNLEAASGIKCDSWQIKQMKTRWGTCNTKAAKLWFNLRLAKYPPDCLEYVILHELAHLEVPNHSRDFYAVIERVMPDWKRRAKILKDPKYEA